MPRRGPIADYEMEYQRVDLGYIAKSASLPDRAIATGEIHGGKLTDATVFDAKIPTGEIHGGKLVDDTTPGDKLVDASLDLGVKGIDLSLTNADIADLTIDLAAKGVDLSLTNPKIADLTIDLGAKSADYTLTDVKVPTGELTFRRMARVVGSDAAVADTAAPLEVVHDFGVEPEHVSLSPGDAGVAGYAILVAKTITSIQIAGSASGVEIYYEIVR